MKTSCKFILGAVISVAAIGFLGYLALTGQDALAALGAAMVLIGFLIGRVGSYRYLQAEATQRKETEMALRKLTLAVEQSPTIVLITDVQGNIEYVNPKFTEVTGYEPHEILGKNPRFLKSGKVIAAQYNKLWDTILSGQEWKGELLNKKKNGDIFWCRVLIAPIRASGAAITHFVEVAEDITAYKKAQEEAKAVLEMKDEFISTVSHELRTPLAISKQAISLFSRGVLGEINDKQKEIIAIAGASLDRLGLLINDILDVSKMEAGHMELRKEKLDIVPVIKDIYRDWQLIAEVNKIRLKLAVPQTRLQLPIDKMRLTQILNNLINNAFKFTPPEGTVTIAVEEDDQGVTFSVRDTGPGIPPENLAMLFKKFVQLHRGTISGSQGTGLGLHIVKSLVELHGGRVGVKSEPGKETVFYFTLPKTVPALTEQE